MDNESILGDLLFCATMQLRIPLRVLSRHGETSPSGRKPPAIAQALHEGIWTQLLRGQRRLSGTMASDIGPIHADGGEYLHFLLAVRRIVEPVTPINERVAELRAELTKPRWQDFVTRQEERIGSIVNHLFPPAINTIPGLPEASRVALKAEGINTAAKIAAMPDVDLLAIKGVGKAKLKAIRDWEATIQDRDAARLENICR